MWAGSRDIGISSWPDSAIGSGNHPFDRALSGLFRSRQYSLSGAGELATRVGDRLSVSAIFSDASEDQMTS